MIKLPLLQIDQSGAEANDSFYSLAHTSLEGQACQGLACFVARHLKPETWKQACAQEGKLYCLGKCYAGPATSSDDSRPIMEVHSRQPVVLERIIAGGARNLDAYLKFGGYKALATVPSRPPEETLATI